MAVRRTALFIGDKSMAGTIPLTDFTAINPTYGTAQADCQIWNIQTSTWEPLQPGVNTNPSTPGTDRSSLESRYREAIRSQFPTGTHYVIKHALDSTLGPSAKPNWLPGIAGNAYATLISVVTAAAAAAHLVGDTLSIEVIVPSFITDDWKTEIGSDSYAANLQGMLQTLRTVLPTIPYCSTGVLGAKQVAIVETPYGFVGLDHATQFRLLIHRASVARFTYPPLFSAGILNTHSLSLAVDNETFSAAAILDLGSRLGSLLFPAQATDGTNLEAPIVAFFGDSILEGAALNTELPAHLLSALDGVLSLNWKTQQFQTFQVGVNNLVSIDQGAPAHGPEPYLLELCRALWKQVWFVKSTIIGSTTYFWSPYFLGYLFDAGVRNWLRNAVQILRKQNKKPAPKLFCISLGTNDIIEGYKPANDVGLLLETFVSNTLLELSLDNVDTSGLKFVFLIPRDSVPSDPTRKATVRSAIQGLKEKLPNVETVDLQQHSSTDLVHLNGAGEDSCAQAIFDVFRGMQDTSKVQPLFAPTREFLVRALKLSQVPQENDGYTQIDTAVQTIRMRFYQQLGTTRVTELSNLPYTANATSTAEQMRALAVSTEIKWVRHELMRTMPTLFKAGTSLIQSWDAEAGFRENTYLSMRDELKRLESEIQEALVVLSKQDLTFPGSLSASAVGPETPAKPGDTVFKVI